MTMFGKTRPMRLASLAAAFALIAAPALAAPHVADAAPAAADSGGDPTTTDLRCMVVAAALVSSDDEQMRSLGRANLFYFLGRLQGRGATVDMNNRLVDLAAKMNEDDIKAEAKNCGAVFTGATQALQDMSTAFAQHFGKAPAGAAPPPK
jgi:hypothetical protein